MRRRDFVALFGASVTWPFAAVAQEPGRMYRIGSLFHTPRSMLGSGLVHSMSKPEGNTTGNSLLSTELDSKRQEILMEALPEVRHMAALARVNSRLPQHSQVLQELARARGVELLVYQVSKPEEITEAIDTAKSSGAEALNVLASPFMTVNTHIVRERVATLTLPTIYFFPEAAEGGGLIGYGPRITQFLQESMARQLASLLRGAQVADVPVEQPTKFELVINLKAAKALGLSLPESFLVRADKVLE